MNVDRAANVGKPEENWSSFGDICRKSSCAIRTDKNIMEYIQTKIRMHLIKIFIQLSIRSSNYAQPKTQSKNQIKWRAEINWLWKIPRLQKFRHVRHANVGQFIDRAYPKKSFGQSRSALVWPCGKNASWSNTKQCTVYMQVSCGRETNEDKDGAG